MKKLLLLLLISCGFAIISQAQDIIPAPLERVLNPDSSGVRFIGSISIYDPSSAFKEEVQVMDAYFNSIHSIRLNYITAKARRPYILLQLSDTGSTENYELNIDSKGITIIGSKAGIFYGLHSLLQLAKVKGEAVSFRSQKIKDEPRYSWRGLHLDVCRHFFSIDYVKKYLDLMARHKFNTFHWHLTDDQGWRIEIKKYPKLTQVGAWRNGSMIGQYRDSNYDTIRYGGFYTQEEIKEVVEYARLRHITVVPEIEMPGHAVAAIATYPQLGCTGKQIATEKTWGVFNDVYCAGNEEVFTFLQDVLDEVCVLFPGKIIHIGGDECPKENWKVCPKCQKRIKENELKDEHELQSYFIQRIEKYLNGKGKKIIGWDEILEGGLAPNAAVMSWRGIEGAVDAANQGHQAVLTPGSHCYFDHYQGDPSWEPISIGGYTNVKKVYSFDPVPADLDSSKRSLILGGQANLWSEYILSEAHMDYMVYPRACAMAEALWLPAGKKNETDFLRRLTPHLLQLEKEGVNVSWSHYRPEYVTTIEAHKPGIAIRPNTADKVVIEYIPAPLSGLPIKKAVIKPDSLVENCTALKTTYKYKFVSLPGSGKVVIYSGPNYVSKDTLNVNFSLSSGAKITLKSKAEVQQSKASRLVDGLTDDQPFYESRWVAVDGNELEAELDLGDIQRFTTVKIHQYDEKKNHIYPASIVEVEISADGQKFEVVKPIGLTTTDRSISFRTEEKTARYIRIKARNTNTDKAAKLYIDEISVD